MIPINERATDTRTSSAQARSDLVKPGDSS
jgi:hypothetical protein